MKNHSPQHTTPQLISQSQTTLPTIAIQPKGDHERGYAPEIINIKENKLNGTWEIEVRWKSFEEKLMLEREEVKSLFPEVTHEETANRMLDEMTDWWMAIDEELARPRIYCALVERELELGTSALEKKYWKLSPNLSEKEKAVLCYFLPFADRIKNDVDEMSYCFTTFLERPIDVERINAEDARPNYRKGIRLHHWQIGLNSKVGGTGEATADEIKIIIKSDSSKELEAFLSEQPKRQLLEQILIPAFIDSELSWQIELELTGDNAFIIDNKQMPGVNYFKISA